MTVEDAREFFDAIPTLARKLQTLVDVGLSYLKLGQSATTLSGGEAQRVKLARELSKRDTGRTLYILDEPTTGLHFEDIKQLLAVLHRLRDHGNTVVIIEHNLDVIKTADWVIDLGPEGGSGGGQIIAEGTPEVCRITIRIAHRSFSHDPYSNEKKAPKALLISRNQFSLDELQGFHSASTISCGRSTSSTIAIGAASPARKPHLSIRM